MSSHPPGYSSRMRGFTLLELLVALSIFAIMSALAYGGLSSILTTREQTDLHAQRLQQLQKAIGFIARDISQTTTRGIRDEFGDAQPPMQALPGSAVILEFTHGGWHNPLELQRSTLQRVAYGIRDQQLVRSNWRVLDRVQGGAIDELILLDAVTNLEVRFLAANNEWQDSWPPLTNELGTTTDELPLAIEIQLELSDWGNIKRLFVVQESRTIAGEPAPTGGEGS